MEFETPQLSESVSEIFEEVKEILPDRDYSGFFIGLHCFVAAACLGLQVYNLQMNICKIQ